MENARVARARDWHVTMSTPSPSSQTPLEAHVCPDDTYHLCIGKTKYNEQGATLHHL